MKCQKCGEENENNARFCKSCGNPLEQKIVKHSNILSNKDNTKTIIITLIAIALIVLIGVGVYASGIFTPDVPLNTQDFGAFKVDVPEGSKMVLKDAATNNPNTVGVSYENKGKYHDELAFILVGTDIKDSDDDNEVKLVETDGIMKVYKYLEPDSTGTCCIAYVDKGDCQFEAIGYDLNTVKRVAKTFQQGDLNKLKNNATELNKNVQASASSTSSSTPSSSSSTPSSISILGGSFSTGSAEEDKTYARINVGTSHAGEDVIVQILYSRDGNSLNNGNMVPASVHSDGYLEIASADAYHYYPDHATIKIYDSNSRLLTTQSVSLSPTSGTQTF